MKDLALKCTHCGTTYPQDYTGVCEVDFESSWKLWCKRHNREVVGEECESCGFEFERRRYYTAEDLGKALAMNLSAAKATLGPKSISDWLAANVGRVEIWRQARSIEIDSSLTPDDRLAMLVTLLCQDGRIYWQGKRIDIAWMSSHRTAGLRFLKSDIPQKLALQGMQRWPMELQGAWSTLQEGLKGFNREQRALNLLIKRREVLKMSEPGASHRLPPGLAEKILAGRKLRRTLSILTLMILALIVGSALITSSPPSPVAGPVSEAESAEESTSLAPEVVAPVAEAIVPGSSHSERTLSSSISNSAQLPKPSPEYESSKTSNSQVQEGLKLASEGMYYAALRKFRSAAQDGNVEAKYYYGWTILGKGFNPQEADLARASWKEASNAGYAPASLLVAEGYEDGSYGFEMNVTEARRYYGTAIDQMENPDLAFLGLFRIADRLNQMDAAKSYLDLIDVKKLPEQWRNNVRKYKEKYERY